MIHIVFDLDGTLADTQRIHEKIESDFLASKGVIIEPTLIGKTYAGRSPSEWIPECLAHHSVLFSHDEIDVFIESKDDRVIALLSEWEISLMPWVIETLNIFQTRWIKMGISSGACRTFIDAFIAYFSLDMIESSTSANEVEHKKPAPDVFLSSFAKLENLYGKPTQKWVVWDGKTDVIGGRASWAQTVLCFHEYPEISPDFQITRFSELQNIIS
jgi:beta-phosphoglucomutase-like phosphatase (HAD superfamily)